MTEIPPRLSKQQKFTLVAIQELTGKEEDEEIPSKEVSRRVAVEMGGLEGEEREGYTIEMPGEQYKDRDMVLKEEFKIDSDKFVVITGRRVTNTVYHGVNRKLPSYDENAEYPEGEDWPVFMAKTVIFIPSDFKDKDVNLLGIPHQVQQFLICKYERLEKLKRKLEKRPKDLDKKLYLSCLLFANDLRGTIFENDTEQSQAQDYAAFIELAYDILHTEARSEQTLTDSFRASFSRSVKKLEERRLLEGVNDEGKKLKLTEEGKEVASELIKMHKDGRTNLEFNTRLDLF